MNVQLPQAADVAGQEARLIHTNRDQYLRFPVDRILVDAPRVRREDLLAGLVDFHRQRMAMVPSLTQYPESGPWVEHVLAVDRELQRLAPLNEQELAVFRSLHPFVAFRGFGQAALKLRPQPAGDEKCRVAYVPDTDGGEVVLKNVDDPITHWKPDPHPPRFGGFASPLRSDGVGNGLHMDQEPDELFPLRPLAMMPQYCRDVPAAVEFLTRYAKFWGSANVLLHDEQKRSAAIEKCSFSHIEVFHPGPDGRSHISGMTCRDPQSPQGSFQRSQRHKYLDLYDLGPDGPDSAFWAACATFESKLANGLEALGPRPRWEALLELFKAPWPQGLNKAGLKLHPRQGLVGYTLIIHATLISQRRFLRWQRSQDGKTFDAQPQSCSF